MKFNIKITSQTLNKTLSEESISALGLKNK